MSFLFFKKYFKNYILGVVVLAALAVALGYIQYQFLREGADIVPFVKGQEALYLTIPESNNVVMTLSSSRIPGSGVSDNFLYGVPPDTHDVPAAFILAEDAKHIIDAGEVNGEQSALMPFYTDLGGSGTFLYVGLFSRIKEPHIPNETLKHENSLFIGDRVLLTGISKNSDGVFTISYLTRKDDEPMAANPTVPAVKYMMVIPVASLVELWQ